MRWILLLCAIQIATMNNMASAMKLEENISPPLSMEQLIEVKDVLNRVMNGETEAYFAVRDEEVINEVTHLLHAAEEQGIFPANWDDTVEMYEEAIDDASIYAGPSLDGLPDCGGFWVGCNYKGAGKALYEPNTSKYWYYWSPNCWMLPPDNACGNDSDDSMTSFFLGRDWTSDMSKYRCRSENTFDNWYIDWHDYLSFRLYVCPDTQYGDAYVCANTFIYEDKLRFGRVR